jgi:hypothetical protein
MSLESERKLGFIGRLGWTWLQFGNIFKFLLPLNPPKIGMGRCGVKSIKKIEKWILKPMWIT